MELINFLLDGHKIGEQVLTMFLDLTKAFIQVDFDNILFYKLNFIGVRGVPLYWVKSNMHIRIQAEQISKDISNSFEIKFGVHQSSVLRPILFLIHINKLTTL